MEPDGVADDRGREAVALERERLSPIGYPSRPDRVSRVPLTTSREDQQA